MKDFVAFEALGVVDGLARMEDVDNEVEGGAGESL